MGWWYNFPKAAPRPKPKPGKSGKKFGMTWWGKKWTDALSQFENDQRMSRGRAYARADRVKHFKIEKGKIKASVKGSLGTYHVNIKFDEFKDKDWNRITTKLDSDTLLVGKLLNNEMPEDLEESCGYTLIPKSFKSECSCPDYANPCKHIAAVFYTLADEIDYDPMILFKLRGMEKEKLFNMLGLSDEPTETIAKSRNAVKRKIVKGGKKEKQLNKRKNTAIKRKKSPRKKSKKDRAKNERKTPTRSVSRKVTMKAR
jgi:uncharacterized Zn finger protein